MRKREQGGAPAALVLAIAFAVVAGLVGCGPGGPGVRESPARAQKAQKAYMYFPPPPEAPRVQFLRHLRSAEDFAVPKSRLAEFITGGETKVYKTIAKGYGIAVRKGSIFCTDTKELCVAVMDFRRRRFWAFGREGPGQLRKPINIRLDQSGRLYVTDTLRRQIVVFDSKGKYLAEYGDGKEFTPSDVIISDGELYVLDIAAHGIKVYDLKTRELKRSFGGRGKGFGQFNYPTNMVMDGEGNIYVCDSMNFRVQKIDREGKALFQFGSVGRTPGHFARPRGVAVDRNGIIYVADAVLGIVQMFDQKGTPLMHFGETGTEDGRLYLPAQVIVDYDNIGLFKKYIAPDFEAEHLILVTNQLGPNKVSVFAFGRRKGSQGGTPPG